MGPDIILSFDQSEPDGWPDLLPAPPDGAGGFCQKSRPDGYGYGGGSGDCFYDLCLCHAVYFGGIHLVYSDFEPIHGGDSWLGVDW